MTIEALADVWKASPQLCGMILAVLALRRLDQYFDRWFTQRLREAEEEDDETIPPALRRQRTSKNPKARHDHHRSS